MPQPNFLEPNDTFVPRHIGPTDSDIQEMLATLSLPSLEALVEATVPSDIRLQTSLTVPSPRGEQQVLAELRGLAGQNQVWRSLIGMGYYDCITPLVIQRNTRSASAPGRRAARAWSGAPPKARAPRSRSASRS